MSKEEIENMIWEIVREEIEEQENINDGCKGCFFDYYGLKCNRPLHYEPFVLDWNVQTVNRLYSLKNNNAQK